jgi:mitochondrial fission protein ELM1
VSDGQITVWCLLGKKAGDNTQVLALAEELGWAYEQKSIQAKSWELLVHLGPSATLAGIDQANSSPLQAPWPDLVISAGRRNEPVAQWIRTQSGSKTRLVHMGRPWASLASWDLIVTTPQYFLPRQANIIHNSLPLHRMTPAELQAAGEQLRPQIAHLPRPWIALLMGGDSGRFVLTGAKGEQLGRLASDLAAAAEGTLLVTDSPRTPQVAGDAMQSQLREPNFCYRFGEGGDNPYKGLLALADAFIVTGESMSMLGEAVDSGRPLYIFDVGDGDTPWWTLSHSYRYKPVSHRLAMALGPVRMRRDIGNIQNALVEGHRAQWLAPDGLFEAGNSLQAMGSAANVEQLKVHTGAVAQEELERTADAVRQLVPAP